MPESGQVRKRIFEKDDLKVGGDVGCNFNRDLRVQNNRSKFSNCNYQTRMSLTIVEARAVIVLTVLFSEVYMIDAAWKAGLSCPS